MDSIHADLKKIPRTVGPTVNEAEEVLKKYEVIINEVHVEQKCII